MMLNVSSYKRGDARQPRQYATAINVNLTQCRASFNLSQNNFLTQEDARIVKNAIDAPNAVYQGQQLIAAGVRNMGKYNYHSEFLLLHPPENSLMTNLLNRNNQDCSVFYTYNSPCFGTCLNEQGPFNILTALDNWSRRGGIKAFVFKDFWRFDTKKDVESKFKLIASRVPLYRCLSETVCFACNGEGNTPIHKYCLPPRTNRP